MFEYDIYLPLTLNDGTPIPAAQIEQIKAELAHAFGGYTHLQSRSEGVWKVAGVTFHDEVTIVRVLDDGATNFDMARFKERVKQTLQQQELLMVRRRVESI